MAKMRIRSQLIWVLILGQLYYIKGNLRIHVFIYALYMTQRNLS